MTGIACGMRGCTAAIGAVDRHVAIGDQGFGDRVGFEQGSYGGIDNVLFPGTGFAITEISRDTTQTPLDSGTQIQIQGNHPQNFFTSMQLQRADGSFGVLLTANANVYLVLNGGAGPTLWNWDSAAPSPPTWIQADVGANRVVRFT